MYTTEKTLKEMGDKIPADDRSKVDKALADLKKTLEGSDYGMIKTACEKLTEVSYDVFGKVYQQASQQYQQQQGQQGGPQDDGNNGGQGGNGGDNVVDADYEVVDDK